jgi:hypothetical protein
MKAMLTVAIVLCAAAAASGGIIITPNHSDYTPIDGATLGDVKLAVDLFVQDGLARFTFSNVSDGLENSVVFKEIVLDTIDNDTGDVFLWDPHITDASDGVSYKVGLSNGLPGFNSLTKERPALVELGAKKNDALAIGQMLEVTFRTSLADGAGITDYFHAFGGGADTLEGSIGFHGISADIIGGESLSGVVTTTAVPEPALAGLLGIGGAVLLLKRRRA